MCGIFGMVSNQQDVARRISFGLYDLQHRGQEAVGIVVSDVKNIKECRRKGLVAEVFNEEEGERILGQLPGRFGVGHTLYSTIGKGGEEKQPKTFQPLIGDFHGQPFALAHNGNLIHLEELRKEVEEKGYNFQSEVSDTEVIIALLSTSREKDFLEALLGVLPRLKGAFALVILFKDKVIGIRDKFGIRPLCLGRQEGSFILASEDCALHTLRGNFIREICPGELIILGENGIERSLTWAENPQLRFCIFEYIYFARPDSRLLGQRVYSYREMAGQIVAEEHPIEADIVCAVPESGEIYNIGVSQVLGLPLVRAIFRNRYFPGRTFLAPRETDRKSLQRIKFYILRELVHEKRVVITEDSIIRANVSPELVAMLREAGAREVHLRVGSSPIRFPCHLGIDMATHGELVAADLTEEEVGRKVIQTDTLGYLSLEGMVKASSLSKEKLCLGCFTGEYPC